MEELAHIFDECTGSWRLMGKQDKRILRCDRCLAEHPADPDTRLAAIDENYAGIYLRRLTAEGIQQMKDQS